MIYHSKGENMDQQSTEWHKWRRDGIGASESAVVAGISPYKTAFQLWEEKTGRAADGTEIHWGIKRGLELEPKARALFELEFGLDMEPVCREHESLPWLRASLDGWNEEERAVLEIKCPGKKVHQEAMTGIIPEHYLYQLAHQITVMDAKKVYYYSYDGESGICIEKDAIEFKSYITKILKNGSEFWKHVTSDRPPPFDSGDFKPIRTPGKKKDFEILKQCKVDLINAVRSYRKAEDKALEDLPMEDRMKCYDVKIIFVKDHYELIFPNKLIPEKKQSCPLVLLWNEHCRQLSKVRGLAGLREKATYARWKENPNQDYWTSVVKKIAASKFCNGDNNFGGWKADFDWMIKPATHLKVSEGKYDDHKVKVDSFNFDRIFK